MKYEMTGSSLLVHLSGDLDHQTSASLRTTIDKLLSLGGYSEVVFDLSNVTFIDSSGIGLILGRYKLLKSLNKTMNIKSPTPSVDKMLTVSGIYTIIRKI
ncbi:MAG: anti-sigma factor antagonist [Christensenellaceae bacterium]|jgi:stage II sporulation protein AA (anti-sigma F factor antagonist)|nr:anti-sigma factor antagonist [Christensenellaceae bacterium]